MPIFVQYNVHYGGIIQQIPKNITKNPNRFCEKLYARSKLECSFNWYKRRQRGRENNLTFTIFKNKLYR